ncbi:MAG: glycosyltransferase [Acidobacteriota bacterium]
MPAVSVLMAVYNGERHLAAAIDSILAQTHRDFEFIVVDDGSTDGSRAIVERAKDPRIRLIALGRNVGLSAALNEGLAAATSPLVARQDADDLSEPRRLEHQLAVMTARPEVALLGTRATALNEDGTRAGLVWRPTGVASIRWYSLFDNPFAHTSVMFRTRVVRDELGGFDARHDPFSQDYGVWCRVIARHAFANLPDALVRYRVHGASIIGALDAAVQDGQYRERFEAIVREIIARHATTMLPRATLTPDEVRLMAGLVLGLPASSLGAFLQLFERLLAAFLEDEPAALAQEDFRETLARQFDAVAFRVAPATRRSARTVYSHALRHHPRLAGHVSWPRALALMILGKQGRGALSHWRRRLGS